MGYSKVEAEAILQERFMELDDLVQDNDSRIKKLEEEKLLYQVKLNEVAFALGVIKQINQEIKEREDNE